MDDNKDLAAFCSALEAAVIETVRAGFMTKDLALCVSHGEPVTKEKYLTTQEFMDKVSANFQEKLLAGMNTAAL